MKTWFLFLQIVQTGSIYLTVGITAERYIVVSYPLKSRSICTPARVHAACLSLIVIALLSSLPKLLFLREMGADFLTRFVFEYEAWGRALVQFMIPFTLVCALNTCIYVQV